MAVVGSDTVGVAGLGNVFVAIPVEGKVGAAVPAGVQAARITSATIPTKLFIILFNNSKISCPANAYKTCAESE